ncbi:MAG: hypothetical protein IID41_00565 [Planctomycetes bacterium]|nr:hypothetical protein [Planctomycetota bacterium]
MTAQEMRVAALKDQVLSAFAKHETSLQRISEDGPAGDEYDKNLCQMMASAIVGDLAMSRHYAKVEADDA